MSDLRSFVYPISQEPVWRVLRCHSDYRIPDRLRGWLADKGSLTARLLAISGGDLQVEVISQTVEVPRLSERQALGLGGRKRAMIREVILYGAGQPWVYARSVLPLSTLTGRLRKLRQLDNQPLGALLFKDPRMSREPVQIADFNASTKHLLPLVNGTDKAVWGRRSVFRLDNKPLLVSEVFLPKFKAYNPDAI